MRLPPIAHALAACAGLAGVVAPAAAQSPSPLPASPPGYPALYTGIPGIAITDADRAELLAGLVDLGREIDSLRQSLAGKPALLARLPDVQIFYNAVRYPLVYDEFYAAGDVAAARRLIREGLARAGELKAGTMSWTTKAGLVVLGYASKIDGSVQPYGIYVPDTYKPGDTTPHRLDFFLHGRDDKLTELKFIGERQRSKGEFTPPDTFVLQPYGRDCVANRYAGEVDLFEALGDAKSLYPIDPDRVIVRGFSMGGASCWQFATHHADEFCAAAPGAGFTDTATYTKALAPGVTPPPAYIQTLWRLYDPVDYALNLAQLPIVAYSGEIDPQKAAADNMARAMDKVGLKLTHVIGPKTQHRYAAESKPIINQFLDAAAAKGRDRYPMAIRFETYTLRYNHMDWITVDGMGRQWERARVEATRTAAGDIDMKVENVTALTLTLPAPTDHKRVTIDGQSVGSGDHFVCGADGKWHARGPEDLPGLQKVHGLQGPIDDAFMDRFVMVRPTGKSRNARVETWTGFEMEHAIRFWRTIFRGEAPVVDDEQLTDDQIAHSNLILWGDPMSNSVLRRIAEKLPIRWNADGSLHAGTHDYPPGCVPILVYPNPLNPARYVVLNSGITFREGHLKSNAQQTPKLPDWAVIDTQTPPDAITPGHVLDAGFFDEAWKLP